MNPVLSTKAFISKEFEQYWNSRMFDAFNLSELTCSVDQMVADSLDLLVHKLYVLRKNKNSVTN